MISKDMLSAIMQHECDTCVHLFEKFDEAGYDYRPTPGQRNTLELLRFLSITAIGGLKAMASSSFDVFGEYVARVKEMPAADFPARMAEQKREIAAFFDSFTASEFETRISAIPGRAAVPLDQAIVSGPFIMFPAYKMQLFLYAKAAGAHHLVSSNVWQGVDPVAK